MDKKKICIITTKSITIRAFLLGQMNYLSKNNYEVTVICDHDDQLYKVLPKNVIYLPVKMNRGIDMFHLFNCIYFLYKHFKSAKYDIVQYSTPNASLYASIAAWLARIPIRLYCQWGIVYVGFKGILQKLFKIIEKLVCSLSTYVEPDSYGNLLFSQKEGLYRKEKSTVIWNGSANGIDLIKFDLSKKEKWRNEIRSKYSIKSNDLVIGFIGRINRDKGINELLKACKIILQKHSEAKLKLLIIGPEENENGIDNELVTWSKTSNSIIYTGYQEDVEQYISTLDIFVLPSYREGFGSVVIEAESMGVPVIVTDIPGPTDAMQPGITGLVVPKGTVDPLVHAMETLILDPKLRKRMGDNAISFARSHFDQTKLWNFILEDRNRLYQTFVSSKKENINA